MSLTLRTLSDCFDGLDNCRWFMSRFNHGNVVAFRRAADKDQTAEAEELALQFFARS